MKYLNPIILFTGLILIIVGLMFGYKMYTFSSESMNTVVIPNGISTASTALYTPFYAGMCILSGAYLLSKAK